jgi:hypothetical protein
MKSVTEHSVDASPPTPGRVAGEVALSGLVVITCGVGIWGSSGWSLGARLFPTLFGVIVGAMASIHAAAAIAAHWRRPPSEGRAPVDATEHPSEGGGVSGVSALLWILALPVAGVLLGFLVAVPLMTLVYTRLAARESWFWSVASALAMAALVFFVSGVMGIRLPSGVWD